MTPPAIKASRLPVKLLRLIKAFIMVTVVFVYGTLGTWFFLDGKVSLTDAAYRTIVMLATINESFPADMVPTPWQPAFRGFMLTIVLFGIAVILYSLSTITAFFVEGELEELLRRKKMTKEINKIRDHFIVCGAGSTGWHIITELLASRHSVVVIENAADKIERLQHEGIPVVEGDALEDEVLQVAGIDRAKGLTVALPSDRDNLFVTLSASQLNPALRIIARGSDPSTDRKLRKAGASSVVSPPQIGGMRMASEMVRPQVVTFLDRMMRDPENPTRIEEVIIHGDSPFADKTLGTSDFRQKTGLHVVAIQLPGDDRYQFDHHSGTVLKPGTTLIVMGPTAAVAKARKLAHME